MKKAYNIFHLNLAYSSISEEERPSIIEKCYFPLLEVIETMRIPMGIEMSGWTLNKINELSPDWLERFKYLQKSKLCELVGSGYVQLIGPLVPYKVNYWNQRLGFQLYEQILSVRPNIAMMNEMAYSTDLVSIYQEAGYQGIILDASNIKLALKNQRFKKLPSFAKGHTNSHLPILWSESILFQKFQRYIHGDITLEEYIQNIKKNWFGLLPIPIYSNDAEVFDYRPGRFREETNIHPQGEWNRIMGLLDSLTSQLQMKWVLPSDAINYHLSATPNNSCYLTSSAYPIPTKKQAKYNINRWAITGRNDLWINTMCHRIYKSLNTNHRTNSKLWQKLCELWASDYRTHITNKRWDFICSDTRMFLRSLNLSMEIEPRNWINPRIQIIRSTSSKKHISIGPENIITKVETNLVRLELNIRRGMAIHSLAFASQNYVSIIGTIAQGNFSSIEHGIDYYSGHVVMEFPKQHMRVTDLERVSPEYFEDNEYIYVRGSIVTRYGNIVKQYKLSKYSEKVELSTILEGWQRNYNIVRVGNLTLLPHSFNSPINLRCKNGGDNMDIFELRHPCNHLQSVSTLVSSGSGYGATNGRIEIGDNNTTIAIDWDPAECAAYPMLYYQPIEESFVARITFSLSELDETYKNGGIIPSFRFSLRPII